MCVFVFMYVCMYIYLWWLRGKRDETRIKSLLFGFWTFSPFSLFVSRLEMLSRRYCGNMIKMFLFSVLPDLLWACTYQKDYKTSTTYSTLLPSGFFIFYFAVAFNRHLYSFPYVTFEKADIDILFIL